MDILVSKIRNSQMTALQENLEYSVYQNKKHVLVNGTTITVKSSSGFLLKAELISRGCCCKPEILINNGHNTTQK